MTNMHDDDINDLVLLGMARDELAAENTALREQIEGLSRATALSDEHADGWFVKCVDAEKRADELEAALTEARAREAAAWEAGRADALNAVRAEGRMSADGNDLDPGLMVAFQAIGTLTPPTDATAALTARLDAEWDAALNAGWAYIETCFDDPETDTDAALQQDMRDNYALLRRTPKEGV